ncbi:MAG TPA: methyltransferase domain-containing protein [Candidatus Deferrimicrobium sp.]|nr:methyltransferase domain-containing protein [Candidatus Deferrimicrobium sp.]
MCMTVFIKEAIKDFHMTAAIAPSSRYLTRAMVGPLRLDRAKVVVELGTGTGVITRELLHRLPPGSTLIGFETNPVFFHHVKGSLSDSRLFMLNTSAEKLVKNLEWLGYNQVDAVVSSLGLGYMTEDQRHTVLQGVSSFLSNDGIFTHFQYFHGLQFRDGRFTRFDVKKLFRRYFDYVERKMVWCNLPPAYVYISSLI